MTQRTHYLLAALLGAVPGSGCAGKLRPGSDATVTGIAVLEQAQPGSAKRTDPRRAYRATAGRVLPSGSRVTVLDEHAHGMANGAPLAFLNRWHYVEVASSAVSAQTSWTGWLHRTSLAEGPPDAVTRIANAQLSRAARLCPDAVSMPIQCMQTIPSGTPVRVLRCERGQAMVELWNSAGLYMAGFVARRDVGDGCTGAGQ